MIGTYWFQGYLARRYSEECCVFRSLVSFSSAAGRQFEYSVSWLFADSLFAFIFNVSPARLALEENLNDKNAFLSDFLFNFQDVLLFQKCYSASRQIARPG